jgi:hypothetical protein
MNFFVPAEAHHRKLSFFPATGDFGRRIRSQVARRNCLSHFDGRAVALRALPSPRKFALASSAYLHTQFQQSSPV